MRAHIKAITYKPKIGYVLDGFCTQTIRAEGKWPVEVGDVIIFHGWEGRPFRTKWSWKLRVTVNFVERCWIDERGICKTVLKGLECIIYTKCTWASKNLDILARKDGIKPATGLELKKVLSSMHKLDGSPFQIIRWETLEILEP